MPEHVSFVLVTESSVGSVVWQLCHRPCVEAVGGGVREEVRGHEKPISFCELVRGHDKPISYCMSSLVASSFRLAAQLYRYRYRCHMLLLLLFSSR